MDMRKEITLGQALGFLITIVSIIFASWVTTQVNLGRLEVRVSYLEKQADTDRKTYQDAQKEIMFILREIDKELGTKQDRNK